MNKSCQVVMPDFVEIAFSVLLLAIAVWVLCVALEGIERTYDSWRYHKSVRTVRGE